MAEELSEILPVARSNIDATWKYIFPHTVSYISKPGVYTMLDAFIPADGLLKRIVRKTESPEASSSIVHRTVCGLSITHVCNSAQRFCSVSSFI